MLHRMKLQSAPFSAIKAGEKKVELRLYDEKRSCVNEGDMVEFTDLSTGETLVCRVGKIQRFASFEELYHCYDKRSLGYREDEQALPQDMLKYYSEEDIARYGVVALELQI